MSFRNRLLTFALAAGSLSLAACASSGTPEPTSVPVPPTGAAPSPDPRVGLRAGLRDAGTALWNMNLLSNSPSPDPFSRNANSDLAFLGNYAIQGNFNGYQMWDISNPRSPVLAKGFVCPASQSDVSVYRNLLIVSGEDLGARIDCAQGGVRDSVSADRLRGVRIFDISDISNPKNVGNVQTCRGSHTHSVLVPTNDRENIYVYISGSSQVRSPSELAGCVNAPPSKDPNSALFRIEVIKIPLANPAAAAIVSSPRIFNDLTAPPEHGEAPEDIARAAQDAAAARARGLYTAKINGVEQVAPPQFTAPLLDSIMRARGGTGTPSGADSAALRAAFQGIVDKLVGTGEGERHGPTQCHDITLYPAIGLAGGACEGYGMLIDIRDPVNPKRLSAVADSNFSYWHSATFNNDGTKVLFSDEWGGGGGPKCRATDKPQWGANAIFTITGGSNMQFRSYYKMPAAQTQFENCVAHNGSLIPVPGRDIMVQSWYQGGISVFEWTDAARPREIAFFDRGPVDSTRMGMGGTWSAYWYNGVIVSSEIGRGLDILELTPSAMLSQNEIEAAKTVRFDYYNVQGQQKFVWPPSFALARAYADQLERGRSLTAAQLANVRNTLQTAEAASGSARASAVTALAGTIEGYAGASNDGNRVRALATAVRDLAR
jgi:hypothetical protein